MANRSNFLIDDGIIVWFDGPEWDDVVAEVFKQAAAEVKLSAQEGAPWEDRTGDARAGLDTEVEESNGEIVLTLFHTVEYGLWLEVIQNGRFATIMPTLERQAPQIFRAAEAKVANARQGRN
jgi:hypothetical protein